MEHITNHFDLASRRVLEQYKRKPNITALLRIHNRQIQELEDSAQELFLGRFFEHANNYHLRLFATFLGIRLDEIPENIQNLRKYLFMRIRLAICKARSRRTIEDTLIFFRFLTGAITTDLSSGQGIFSIYMGFDTFLNRCIFFVTDPNTNTIRFNSNAAHVFEILLDAFSPIGIRLDQVILYDIGACFGFSDEDHVGQLLNESIRGFGDEEIEGTIVGGGYFAESLFPQGEKNLITDRVSILGENVDPFVS